MSDMQTNFEENKNNQVSQKSHKKIIIGVIVLVIVLSVIGVVLSQTVFLTDEQKDERIAEIYINEGFDAAIDAIVKYYGSSSDKAISWGLLLMDLEEEDEEDLTEQIEIVEQNLTERDSGHLAWYEDPDYYDYEVTVKNNSDETLSYIRVDIYLKDANQNIIYSDWTNWSGSLPPGASTVLDTMIPYQDGVEYYSVSVAEAK